jgi:hypothetical protein
MKPGKRAWSRVIVAAAVVVLAVAAVAASGARDDEGDATPPFCCVANPRFAGICKVELGSGESCSDVLAYLNNAASVGRTYCGNTNVRMGWKQVECQEE